MDKTPLTNLEIPIDGIYLQWINQCKFDPMIKNLFRQLPYIWHDYIYTVKPEPLINFTQQLLRIKREHGDSVDFLPEELKLNASDCFIILGQYQNALDFFPVPSIGSRACLATDSLLSLKFITGTKISSDNILTLLGPKVTKFGKENLDEINKCINKLLEDLINCNNVDCISDWQSECTHYRYQIGLGSNYGYFLTKGVAIELYRFSETKRCIEFVNNITREAENYVREQFNIPKVGEGWISETLLYYQIRQALPNLEIKQHARPTWLGKQHLDIFIPDKGIAIEFQGAQHDRPIEFFGGQNSFEKNKKRDERKKRLCKKHGVKLIYIYPSYNLQSVVEEINNLISSTITTGQM
jgi:hypothetical protein